MPDLSISNTVKERLRDRFGPTKSIPSRMVYGIELFGNQYWKDTDTNGRVIDIRRPSGPVTSSPLYAATIDDVDGELYGMLKTTGKSAFKTFPMMILDAYSDTSSPAFVVYRKTGVHVTKVTYTDMKMTLEAHLIKIFGIRIPTYIYNLENLGVLASDY